MNKKASEQLLYKKAIVSTINRMMYVKGWSIKELSEQSDLPYESVKKLVGGKINNPTIYTLTKISKALGCGLDLIMQNKTSFYFQSKQLSERAMSLITEIANLEMYLSEYNHLYNKKYLTTLVPTGNMQDGTVFDSIYSEYVNIASYVKDFGDIIMCGIKITNSNLLPTYADNDILLIARDRFPVNGENGIFFIGHKAYIRTYILKERPELAPVNNKGDSIHINNINDVHFFGRILTVVRK